MSTSSNSSCIAQYQNAHAHKKNWQCTIEIDGINQCYIQGAGCLEYITSTLRFGYGQSGEFLPIRNLKMEKIYGRV